MSTTVLEGNDGTLYDIPDEVLARYAVPGSKVRELRERLAGRAVAPATAPAAAGSADGDHARLGELPPDHPGYAQQQAIQAAVELARAESGGGVTLNIYVGGKKQPAVSLDVEGDVEGYHMSFDESGVPVSHTDMLWGDYIDKQGNPAVGFHSHDPVAGNAQ